MNRELKQILLTYFGRGKPSVWLTSCLTGLDSTKPVNQHKYLKQLKPNKKIGGQPFSDNSLKSNFDGCQSCSKLGDINKAFKS